MKKKLRFSILFVVTIIGISFSCERNPQVTNDIVGTFTWNEWQNQSGWKDHSASDFVPDTAIVNELKKIINNSETINYYFEIYASNWCHYDCEPQVPKIMKFLKAISEQLYENVIIYGLNRNRTEPENAIIKWNNSFPNKTCYVPNLVIYAKDESEYTYLIGNVKCETSDFPEWQNEILKIIKEKEIINQ